MSKKDFMRGVEANAKANEAFMRKQAAATEELGKRVIQKIDEQGEIIDVVLDTLNSQEKKELYSLQSEYDIADLGDNEKDVLASYLLTLIAKYDQNTEVQKEYYFAVKKHLGVTDVSSAMDLSLVENVDSRVELKAMFQTVCEFLFLKTGDSSFLDEFEDELDCFGLTRKAVREIIESIENIYDVLGLRGIVEHYIPAEAEEEQEEEATGVSGNLTQETVIRTFSVRRGESKVYKDKELEIGSKIIVEGELIFENCIVNLSHMGKNARIELENDALLHFKNCEIQCPKQDKYNAESLICSGGETTSMIMFESSTLNLKNHFIFTVGSVKIKECKIIEPEGYCVIVNNGDENTVIIEDSSIEFTHFLPFGEYSEDGLYGSSIFQLRPESICIITNTKVVVHEPIKKEEKKKEFMTYSSMSDKSGIFYAYSDNPIKFSQCEIVNLDGNLVDMSSQISAKAYEFENCKFLSCHKDIVKGVKEMKDCFNETEVQDRKLRLQKPFDMSIQEIYSNRTVVYVKGTVHGAPVKVNDRVEVIKNGIKKQGVVTRIVIKNHDVQEAADGDYPCVYLDGITKKDIDYYCTLHKVQQTKSSNSFEMMVSSIKKMSGALILSGEILDGTIAIGDTVILPKNKKKVTVSAISAAGKMLTEAEKDDEVDLMVKGVTENDVSSYDLIQGE